MQVPSFLGHVTGFASGLGALATAKVLLERPRDNPANWPGIAVDMAVYALLLLLIAALIGAIHGWLFKRLDAYLLAFSATLPLILLWLILVAGISPGAFGLPVVFLYFFVFALSARWGSKASFN
jgi:hypothetical protein